MLMPIIPRLTIVVIATKRRWRWSVVTGMDGETTSRSRTAGAAQQPAESLDRWRFIELARVGPNLGASRIWGPCSVEHLAHGHRRPWGQAASTASPFAYRANGPGASSPNPCSMGQLLVTPPQSSFSFFPRAFFSLS